MLATFILKCLVKVKDYSTGVYMSHLNGTTQQNDLLEQKSHLCQ